MDIPTAPLGQSFATLPEAFYAPVSPSPVVAPAWMGFNQKLANELNLDLSYWQGDEGLHVLAGNKVAPNSQPVAMAYAGHQFGNWVPQLGDGRAHILGDVRSKKGQLFDMQLKGSGPTPFSRNGDGRAAIGPVLREYVMSEAMHNLGIPTRVHLPLSQLVNGCSGKPDCLAQSSRGSPRALCGSARFSISWRADNMMHWRNWRTLL